MELLDRRVRLEAAQASMGQAPGLERLLREVDSALARLDNDEYGLCQECREPIEAGRLAADPLTRFCLDHLTAAGRRALQEDLDLAVRIQSTLLPSRRISVHGWEACHHYEPAAGVGGDYCDLIPAARDLLFLAGDVSGKGVAASLMMSHLSAIFRSLASVGLPFDEMVRRANRVFCQNTLPSVYATLVCGRAGPDGEVELCNAGHCPPLVRGARGLESVDATGLPLGLFAEADYTARRLQLNAGDFLLLYTDGLTEAQDGGGDEFGADRLAELLAGYDGMDAQAIAEGCLNRWRSFRFGPAADDLTILVLGRPQVRA